jgi:hypothetical protein
VQPPIDLAVLAISNGTSFLRWLTALDQMTSHTPHDYATSSPCHEFSLSARTAAVSLAAADAFKSTTW